MKKEQTSISELFKEVKIANEINEKILTLLDSFTPSNKEKEKISKALEKLINKEIQIRENIEIKTHVELEFIGEKPRFTIFKLSSCGF